MLHISRVFGCVLAASALCVLLAGCGSKEEEKPAPAGQNSYVNSQSKYVSPADQEKMKAAQQGGAQNK